jgi:hypothetical protein
MLKTRNLTLSSTPVNLTDTGIIDPCIVLSVQNVSSSDFAYIGNESVSSSNYGHKLYPGQSFTIELAPNDKVYVAGDPEVEVAVFSLDIG